MPSKRLWLILVVLLALLAACDPVPQPYETVLQVASEGNRLYALVQQRHTWGIGSMPADVDLYYTSSDGGKTWQQTAVLPAALELKIETARQRLTDTCNPSVSQDCTQVNGLGVLKYSTDAGQTWYVSDQHRYPSSDTELKLYYHSANREPVCLGQECFRISLDGHIEHSRDGAATWSWTWRLPPGHAEYLQRYYAARRESIPPDLYPVDITLVESESGMVVVAALGTQGILVRSPEGVWQAAAVGNTQPVPRSAAGLNEAFQLILAEYLRSILIAGLFSGVLAAASWVFLRVRLPSDLRREVKSWPLIYAGLIISASVLLLLPAGIKLAGYFLAPIPVICLPVVLVGVAVAWSALMGGYPRRTWLVPSLLTGILHPLLIFLALLLPYLLWSFGILPSLGWAAGISIALAAAAGIWGLIHAWKLVSRLPQSEEPLDQPEVASPEPAADPNPNSLT